MWLDDTPAHKVWKIDYYDRKKSLLKTLKNFKGLKYRQQIIFKKRNLMIINDSKSTSFASSIGLLKSNDNIYEFDSVYQKHKRSRSSYDISSKWSEERLIYRNRSNSSFSKTLIFIIMILVLLFLYIIDFDLSIFT